MVSSSSLPFLVKRRQTTLVPPAEPTPAESKPLSDIDDQDLLRTHVSFIFFFPHHPAMSDQDPARVIREALAKTLVTYYPFAGRLREGPDRKLVVDCTGEGVLFTDADADLRMDDFGPSPRPPFPCMDQLLHNVPGSDELLHSPLLLIQVTRLACKGFVFALQMNHAMCDAKGIAQFVSAVGEMARGAAEVPSVPPVWRRELLAARSQPRVTRVHHGYNDVVGGGGGEAGTEASDDASLAASEELVHHSFFFGGDDVTALRQHLPPELRGTCSVFDVLSTSVWKCWAAAWGFSPADEVRLYFSVDARRKFSWDQMPDGYYGNVIVVPAAVTTAGDLRKSPLDYAAQLVRKVKKEVDEEYMWSMADLMALEGRPAMVLDRAYCVSDLTRSGLGEVDFGWGKPVYAGPTMGGCIGFMSWTFHVTCWDGKGKEGILVPLCLPNKIMERFKVELLNMINGSNLL